MPCRAGPSNYERKKQSLLNANVWKSNFISLWKTYGDFVEIDGVECFGRYRISGDGVGQNKMATLLRDNELPEKTEADGVDHVDLYFNVGKLMTPTVEDASQWVTFLKAEIEEEKFTQLKYEIVDHSIVSAGFYKDDVLVDEEAYNDIAFMIADKRLAELEKYGLYIDDLENQYDGDFSYDEEATVDSVYDEIESFTKIGFDDAESIVIIFASDHIEESCLSWMAEEDIGTDILNDKFIKKEYAGSTIWYLPLDVCKKMSGLVFIDFLSKTLDFRVVKSGGFWNAIKRIIKLVLAFVAAVFQQYWLSASLLTGFIADVTGSRVLSVVSTVLALFEGDLSLENMGVGEAANLLSNLYGLYIELKFNPASEKTKIEDEEKKVQEMYYKAPYSAYTDLYCYQELISVRV